MPSSAHLGTGEITFNSSEPFVSMPDVRGIMVRTARSAQSILRLFDLHSAWRGLCMVPGAQEAIRIGGEAVKRLAGLPCSTHLI